jgi:pSer/pThr/pTyr-binding forkhead associated (FHA) protein
VPIRLQVVAEDDPSKPVYRYEFDGDRSTLVLGRRGGVDVLLPHPKVSLAHARIERRGTAYTLIDEGSTSGTLLNGVRLRAGARAVLRPGDRIGIADFVIEVGVTLTELDGPGDNSRLIARRMVRDVLERLGPHDAQPRLEVENGATLHLLDLGRTYVLGSSQTEGLALDAVDMWREHVALEREEGGVLLRLLGPSATVRVNGARVEAPVPLHDGDEIELGERRAHFFDPAEAYLRRLEVGPETTSPELPRSHAPRSRRGRRPVAEVALIVAGVLAILIGGAGLVWVVRW